MSAEKVDGVVLGKPKDSLQASMLVKDREGAVLVWCTAEI